MVQKFRSAAHTPRARTNASTARKCGTFLSAAVLAPDHGGHQPRIGVVHDQGLPRQGPVVGRSRPGGSHPGCGPDGRATAAGVAWPGGR